MASIFKKPGKYLQEQWGKLPQSPTPAESEQVVLSSEQKPWHQEPMWPLLWQRGLEVSDVTFKNISGLRITMRLWAGQHKPASNLHQWKGASAEIKHTFRDAVGKGLWRLMFSSSKPIAWLIVLGKELLISLVFIKLGINITAMRPATTTERTQLNLGKKQQISSSFFPHVTRTLVLQCTEHLAISRRWDDR